MQLDIKKMEIAMARKQMSRKDLANHTGLSEQTINAYFQQKFQPSVLSIGKLAEALCVDVTELID